MANVDTIDITKLIMVEQGSTPSNPSAGKQKLFIRTSDHLLCTVDSSGTVTPWGGALTNPMSAVGDLIRGGTSGTPTRLASGTAGYLLSSTGTTSVPAYISPAGLILGSSISTNAPVTSSSTTLVDMDATRIAVTFTAPASGNVLVVISCRAAADNGVGGGIAGDQLFFGVRESSSIIAGPSAIMRLEVTSATVVDFRWITYMIPLTGISAGSHTYKGAFCVTNGSRQAAWVQESAAEPATMMVMAL